MKTENAAFSKSVIWTSMLRNSTRQPIVEFPGGLKRTVCQLVDWIFCRASPHQLLATASKHSPDLKMVVARRVVLVNHF